MRRQLVCVATVTVLAACGGGSRGSTPGVERPLTAAEKQYPALTMVPADATYAVVSRRTGEMIHGLREIAIAATILIGTDIRDVDAELQHELGTSWLDSDALEAIGIDLDRSMTLFGQKGMPTLLLPVADGDKLKTFLDRQLPWSNVSSERHRDREVFTWKPHDDVSLSWFVADGWLGVHLGLPKLDGGGFGWLDAMLAVAEKGGLGGHEDLTRAIEFAGGVVRGLAEGEEPGVIGLLRPAELLALLRDHGAPEAIGCLGALTAITGRVYLAGRIGWDGASGSIGIELAPDAAQALRDHLAPDPPPGYAGVRAASAFYFDWNVDLKWLEGVRKQAMCPLFDQPIEDPFRRVLRGGGPVSYHLALADLDIEAMTGRVAVHAQLAGAKAVRKLIDDALDQLGPIRSLFEKSKKVGKLSYKLVSVPGFPTSISYRLTDSSLTAAVGDGVMKELLGQGDGTGQPSSRLAAMGLFPQRLPKLGSMLESGMSMVGQQGLGEFARAAAQRLLRYVSGEVAVELHDDVVVLRADMKLARQ